LRVVYVSTLERGGPLSHLRDLAPAVARAGADVHVVCASEEVARGFRSRDVDASVAPLRHKLDLPGATRIWPLLRGADVVHTHDRRAGLLARTQGRARGARVVHTLHGLPEEIAVRVGRANPPVPPGVSRARLAWLLHGYLRVEGLLSALGDVVVPSQAMATYLGEHGVAERRLHVIPLGIDAHPSTPRPAATAGPLAIGTAANLEYWKGIDVLLAACARLRAPYRLDVFGDGSERQALEAQAARDAVAATFHGFVDDFRSRLEGLDVFVLASRAENLPVSILEAMAARLPVVGTRAGGIPELVADGETGLVVDPDDPAALAAALDRLAAEPALREELGRRGAERAAELFSAEAMARRMLRLYEDLCASST
jgi:glycosyltransferase involved in cell wall biosynthesis